MKILASILLIFITSMCFGQDYYAIMKKRRLDKIYDMLTFDFQVRKFQWLKTLDIKNFKAQEGFKKQNLVIEKYEPGTFLFEIAKFEIKRNENFRKAELK